MEQSFTPFRAEAQRKYREDPLFKSRVDEAAAAVAASFAFPTSAEQFMVACLAYERIASLPQEPVDTREIVVGSVVRVAEGAQFRTHDGRLHTSGIPAPCLATVQEVPAPENRDPNYTLEAHGVYNYSVLPEYVSLVS